MDGLERLRTLRAAARPAPRVVNLRATHRADARGLPPLFACNEQQLLGALMDQVGRGVSAERTLSVLQRSADAKSSEVHEAWTVWRAWP